MKKKRATQTKSSRLPRFIYATTWRDRVGVNVVAGVTLDVIDDGAPVGIYELKTTHVVRVLRRLEDEDA